MRYTSCLAVLAIMVLVTGGCTASAPQPAPAVLSPQEQTALAQVTPTEPEKSAAPEAAVVESTPAPATPVPTEPVATVKTAPVEIAKVVPAAPVMPKAPAATAPGAVTAKPAATIPAAAKTVTYTATNGNVTFNHLQHAGNNPCSSCHPSTPPAKIVLGKEKAHQLCKGCHQQKSSGPTQCTGCHKKG
jgi:hypothetical protein